MITAEIGGKRYVDIDIKAVDVVMGMFDVRNKKSCLIKVLKLFHHFISKEL